MKTCLRFWLIGLLALWGFTSRPASASLVEVSSATASVLDGGYSSGFFEPTNGFVVFASSLSISLNPVGSPTTYYTSTIDRFSQVGNQYSQSTILLPVNIGTFTVSMFDPGTGFAYFASSDAPSGLMQIDIANPVTFSSITLPSSWTITGVLDSTNHMAYLGTNSAPAYILKVQLPNGTSVSSMTVVSTMTLPGTMNFLSASAIDVANGFAYFASRRLPGAIAKIDLSNFSLAGVVQFQINEGGVGALALDQPAGNLFAGTLEVPAKIIEVRTSDLTELNTITLQTGEDRTTSVVVDMTALTAYFGTDTSPGIVVPVQMRPLAEGVGSLTLAAGQNRLRAAIFDSANTYAYFGTFTTPGRVVKIDPIAGAPVIAQNPADANVHAGETASFSVRVTGRSLTYQWQLNGVDIAGATGPTYSRVVTLADDGAAFRCVITNGSGSVASREVHINIIPVVRAYPNPWRPDRGYQPKITFDGLVANSTIKIFTLSMHWVKTLSGSGGTAPWDLTNDHGEPVASGYYFYLVTTGKDEQTVHGKLAVIR